MLKIKVIPAIEFIELYIEREERQGKEMKCLFKCIFLLLFLLLLLLILFIMRTKKEKLG